jgi:hypothetical protein
MAVDVVARSSFVEAAARLLRFGDLEARVAVYGFGSAHIRIATFRERVRVSSPERVAESGRGLADCCR